MDLFPAILDVCERYSSTSFVLLLCTLTEFECTATALHQLQNVVLLLPIHIYDCFIEVPFENKHSMRTLRSRPKRAVQLSGNTSQPHEEFMTSVLSCKAYSPCRYPSLLRRYRRACAGQCCNVNTSMCPVETHLKYNSSFKFTGDVGAWVQQVCCGNTA